MLCRNRRTLGTVYSGTEFLKLAAGAMACPGAAGESNEMAKIVISFSHATESGALKC